MISIINSLETAADAYIAANPDDPQRDLLFMAVEEWVAASYEKDGYRDQELEQMDFKSAAQDYIERRRVQKR